MIVKDLYDQPYLSLKTRLKVDILLWGSWEKTMSSVIIRFSTLVQFLCIVDSIYHSAVTLFRTFFKKEKKFIKLQNRIHIVFFFLSVWQLSHLVYLLFIHESILPVLSLFMYLDGNKLEKRLQRSSHHSPLLTVPKDLSTNMGYSFLCARRLWLWRTATGRFRWKEQGQWVRLDTTMKDDSVGTS